VDLFEGFHLEGMGEKGSVGGRGRHKSSSYKALIRGEPSLRVQRRVGENNEKNSDTEGGRNSPFRLPEVKGLRRGTGREGAQISFLCFGGEKKCGWEYG